MTGCLDELMEKATEMGLDECWDEVSDEDKLVLEPIFRSNPQNKFIFCPAQGEKKCESKNKRSSFKSVFSAGNAANPNSLKTSNL